MDIALAGGSGFAGLRLAAELLSRGHRLTLLATCDPTAARARLVRRMTLLGYPQDSVMENADRVDAAYVDPGAPHLGLGPAGWESLADRFDALWHVPTWPDPAQSCEFADGSPFRGARALLPLAAHGDRETVFHQVSTVLAHGTQPAGVVRETAAVVEHGACRNQYEKAHAEADLYVEVFAAQANVPAVVHRTGLLVTDLAHHPELPRHPLSHAAAVAAQALRSVEHGSRLTLSLSSDPEAQLNLLPVAAATRVMAEVGEQRHEDGARLVHVVNAHGTPVSLVLAAFERLFPLRLQLRASGAAHLPVDAQGTPAGLQWLLPYLRLRHSYETTALREFGIGLEAPPVTIEYLIRSMKGAATAEHSLHKAHAQFV